MFPKLERVTDFVVQIVCNVYCIRVEGIPPLDENTSHINARNAVILASMEGDSHFLLEVTGPYPGRRALPDPAVARASLWGSDYGVSMTGDGGQGSGG